MNEEQPFAHGDLVSVIIPVHNRAHLLERSVGSICTQSYDNLEILVVDDASTDDIDGAVRALDDPRIRLIRRTQNGGVAAARNDGMAAARGALVAFNDSDDICVFNRIERQVTCLCDQPEMIGVYSARIIYMQVSEQGYGGIRLTVRPRPHERPLSGDLAARTVENNIINFPTMMARRSALERAGPCDALLRNNVDWDQLLRLTREGPFAFIPEPLLYTPVPAVAQVSGDRISQSNQLSMRSFTRISGKLRRDGHGGRALAGHYCTTASYLLRGRRSRSARRFLRAAMQLAPLSPRAWRVYALSYTPGLYTRIRGLRRRMRR